MVQIANLQYGWTLFVGPIEQRFHWGRAAIQVAFTLFVLAETRASVQSMMREAQEIGERLGARFTVSLERRIAGAEAVGKHKTYAPGRGVWAADGAGGAAGRGARAGPDTGTPTPHLGAVFACASLLARTLAEARGRLQIRPAS